jgi:lipase chaperone LimK
MEKRNVWLEMNLRTIQAMRNQLVDYHMKGSYGGELPLLQIERVLRQAVEEINKLQTEVNNLDKRLVELLATEPEQEEKVKSG